MNIPNYKSFYEGHYNILWIPYIFLVKSLARRYVTMRNRKDYFIDELTFTNPRMIRKIAGRALREGVFCTIPHLDGMLKGNIARLYYYLKLKLEATEDQKFIRRLQRNRLLRPVALIFAQVLVTIFVALGFSRTFNLIYFKRNRED